MNHRVCSWTLASLALLAPLLANSSSLAADDTQLTLERIFTQREFDAKSYSAEWTDDGYLTLEKSAAIDGAQDIVRHPLPDGEPEVLVPADQLIPPGKSEPLKIDAFQFSQGRERVLIYTNSQRVWRQNTRGDYWVLDRSSRQLHQLGGDAPPASLMFAKLSPDGRQAAYVRDRNIYLEDLRSQEIRPLTRTQTDHVINGTFDWVYEEEFGLRDGFRFSPDGRWIAFWQIDTTGVARFPLVNNTDSLYPRVHWFAYPKVGQQNSACRLGCVELSSGETRWLELPGDSRDHYVARMQWAGNSHQLLVQQLNRRQNANRLLLLDVSGPPGLGAPGLSGPAEGSPGPVTTLLTETDPAWVDVHDELFWVQEGRQFTWISQRDGWRHAYLVPRSGEPVRLATPGQLDVIRLLHADSHGSWLYFLASPDNPTQRYLYRVQFDGTQLERLSPPDPSGTHDYSISPDGRWAIHTYSALVTPPRTCLISLPDHRQVRVLQDNTELRQRLEKLALPATEFFRVDIGEGVELDAWCIQPPKLDPARKYPLLVYVYGEPAGQTVLDRWGGANLLWHLMLAQQGYVVMSFDNRGTPAPRGRDWRKCVYRQVGVLAPQDQATAVRAVLRQRSFLDGSRVGVWGWSGGGSMTLNALFKFPQLYHTGISIAPVPNQRYYDTIYQERYMGLPEDNVDGFLEGSPINFAHQLEGNLLLVHGTGDDNCHYQTTEMLINELIRHNKRFTMMAYPNRSHSIREGTGTTRHLRELMTTYLQANLPPGPRDPDSPVPTP